MPIDEQYEQLTEIKLKKGEKVQHHYDTIMKKTENMDMPEAQEITLFKRGLPKYIKKYIKQERPEGLLDTLKKAK